MKRFLSSLPVQLLVVFLFSIVASSMLPYGYQQFFYTISLVGKEILEFFLPIVILFFVGNGILSLQNNSLIMLCFLIGSVFFSNIITAFSSYIVSIVLVVPFITTEHCLTPLSNNGIEPLCSFTLPVLFPSEKALIVALVGGIIMSLFPVNNSGRTLLYRISFLGKTLIEKGLKHFFIPFLPVYMFGFFLNLFTQFSWHHLCGVYGLTFSFLIGMQLSVLAITYFFAAGGNLTSMVRLLVNALPSYLTALGTMSSIASLPVSIKAAERNTGNRSLAEFAMPLLANIHLMGDAVTIPLFSVVTSFLFLHILPSFTAFCWFSLYFCVSMLAVSGVPGGGIIVMLPLLKNIFGFTPEMLGIITGLYLLQDAFGTAANVMGDGALVVFLQKMIKQKKV